jgi:hypothetical protein
MIELSTPPRLAGRAGHTTSGGQRMAIDERELLKVAIGRALSSQLGASPSATAVGAATVATWDQLAACLVPVIGRQGVDVLFSRAVHLTIAAYPWLEVPGARHDGQMPLTDLRSRLELRDPEAAAAASQAVLLTFAELLSSLIGQPLTDRLLAPVWAASGTPTRAEETGP